MTPVSKLIYCNLSHARTYAIATRKNKIVIAMNNRSNTDQ